MNLIPIEALTILATIGLTPDQAAQVASAYRLIEQATSDEGQSAEAKTLRQDRNARYYDRRKGRLNGVLQTSNGVLKRLNGAKEKVSPIPPLKEKLLPLDDDKSSSAPTGGRRRGSRLVEDWIPSEALFAHGAEKKGLSRAEVLEVAEEFKNYWIAIPGAKGCKLDWDRTFINRMNDQAPRFLKRPNRLITAVHGTGAGVFIKINTPQWDAWAARYRRQGKSPPMSAKGGWHFPTEWPNSESHTRAAE